jgi:molecular chaperone HtpG
VLSELERVADKEPVAYANVWETFGVVLKEGLYEDYERRDALLALARFKSTGEASGGAWRSLKEYVAALRPNQTAIYYLAGDDLERLKSSPQLEGFRARGIEVLLLPDPVDSFWVMSGISFDGKPFKSVTQGATDLAAIPRIDAKEEAQSEAAPAVKIFVAFVKSTLGGAVSDVRLSDRLTDSAVCLVAPEGGPDRALERILSTAGRLPSAAKPILEVNPRHQLVTALAGLDDTERAFKEDAAHLLLDEARVLDGERPADAGLFSQRLMRLLERGVRQAK